MQMKIGPAAAAAAAAVKATASVSLYFLESSLDPRSSSNGCSCSSNSLSLQQKMAATCCCCCSKRDSCCCSKRDSCCCSKRDGRLSLQYRNPSTERERGRDSKAASKRDKTSLRRNMYRFNNSHISNIVILSRVRETPRHQGGTKETERCRENQQASIPLLHLLLQQQQLLLLQLLQQQGAGPAAREGSRETERDRDDATAISCCSISRERQETSSRLLLQRNQCAFSSLLMD